MNQKKKLIISIISVLAVVLVVAGVTYAIFAITTNSSIVQGNSGKLDVNYTISNANLTGVMMPSASRNDNLKETVTAKLNSGSIDGALNIYLTPTTITGLPKEAINWEVDAIDSSSNLLDHYAGNLSSSTVNSPVTIVDGYDLSTTNVTFNIYVWLNGELLTNSNFSDTNSFVATISADSEPVTGRFGEYTVTFDPNGGSVSPTTKAVDSGFKYGTLPTPTREGYTFLGWNGKNLVSEVTSQNYITYHYRDRTSDEFKNDLIYYARINGNNSDTSIDTSWYIMNNKIIDIYEPGDYCLSFMVRSQNSIVTQSITRRSGSSSGKTGLYNTASTADNQLIATIDKSYSFDNDGDWHTIIAKIVVPEEINGCFLVIGNDTPNIFGPGSYIDIGNIQLEKGSTATAYEPYYVTKSTIVTQEKDHTLTAIWKENS